MEETTYNNKIIDSDIDPAEIEFNYNFINTPWDDRSNKSKVGIVALLIAIFIATMGCVINNFVMHYKGFRSGRNSSNFEINCVRVKIDDYRYVARIYSVSSKEILCVGAVVSTTSILANGVCVKSGPIRVYLGALTNPLCKKGFSVDVIESIYHDGVLSKKLALLSSYENIMDCAKVIQVGRALDWNSQVKIIGRPLTIGRYLSRQQVTLAGKEYMYARISIKHLNKNNMICVKDLARCPVRAGDLLVQNDRLFGVAATSVRITEQNKLACFADLNFVRQELKELDTEIDNGT